MWEMVRPRRAVTVGSSIGKVEDLELELELIDDVVDCLQECYRG